MKGEVIFTIVTRNYVPLANILGASIRALHPDQEFVIVVVEEDRDSVYKPASDFPLVFLEELKVPGWAQMAFKYTLTEFCTALKPSCLKYFFDRGHEKVVYLDPDIYVFSSLKGIFERLETTSIILTPHITWPEQLYSGVSDEGLIMFTGIYNLGFIAVKNDIQGQSLINWWQNRLSDKCYVDKIDGFFTDQKWADFMPALFENVFIERGLGYNCAVWNLHERQLLVENTRFLVSAKDGQRADSPAPLVFFHFSGCEFSAAEDLSKFSAVDFSRFETWKVLFEFYAEKIQNTEFSRIYRQCPYAYNYFESGEPIAKFHRRFYRRLLESDILHEQPFATGADTFYEVLRRNNFLFKDQASYKIDASTDQNFPGFDRKVRIIAGFFSIVKRIIGLEKYLMFTRFATRFFRYENQIFLLKDYRSAVKFKKDS